MKQLTDLERRVIIAFLKEPWRKDIEIARACECSAAFVHKMRSEWYGHECLPNRHSLDGAELKSVTYRVPSRINDMEP